MTNRNKTSNLYVNHPIINDKDGTIWSNQSFLVFYQSDVLTSGNSPRVNGRLVLRENVLSSSKFMIERSSFLSNTYQGKTGDRDWFDYKLDDSTPGSYQGAAAKFYSAAGDLRVNVAQAFAERRQTLDLLTSNATRIYEAFRALRHGRLMDACASLGCSAPRRNIRVKDDVANLWLGLHYGWMPLMQDIYGSMISFVDRPILIPISVGSRLPHVHRGTTKPSWDSEYFSTWTGYGYDKTHIRALFRVTDLPLRTMSSLGLTNPALLVWELIPYSFCVDWFFTAGSYFESLSALDGLSLVSGSTTTTVHDELWIESRFHDIPTYGWPGYVRRSVGNTHLVKRTKNRQLSIPNRPLPRFKNPLSTSHMLSALALLQNVFSSSKRLR